VERRRDDLRLGERCGSKEKKVQKGMGPSPCCAEKKIEQFSIGNQTRSEEIRKRGPVWLKAGLKSSKMVWVWGWCVGFPSCGGGNLAPT